MNYLCLYSTWFLISIYHFKNVLVTEACNHINTIPDQSATGKIVVKMSIDYVVPPAKIKDINKHLTGNNNKTV